MPRRRATPGDPQVVDVLTDPRYAGADHVDDPAGVDSPAAPAQPVAARPLPEEQLSPQQRQLRALQDQAARQAGRADITPEPDPSNTPGAQDNILIHFVADGFTALGAVWYRGQELEFTPGSAAYRDTCDRTGWSWLELRADDNAQIRRWREVKFRAGPWPGESLDEVGDQVRFEPLKTLQAGQMLALSPEELAGAARAERARHRAAPRLPRR